MRKKTKTWTVQVGRYLPEEQSKQDFVTYEIPASPGMSIMGALRHIQENIDPTLAFDCSCRIGICKACALRADGEIAMACSTPVRDGMKIEPVNERDNRRDLIVRPAKFPESVSAIAQSFPQYSEGE